MSWIINSPDFVKNLDLWLLHSKQPQADWLFKNKEKIPPVFRTLHKPVFRGVVVEREEMQKFPMVLKFHTSWSKDEKLATSFAKDIKAVHANRKMNDPVGLLIKKQFPPSQIIIDIDAYVSFMGIPQLEMMGFDEMNLDSAQKESEVIVGKNTKVSKTDIKKVWEF